MTSIRIVSKQSVAAAPSPHRRIDELAGLLSEVSRGLQDLRAEMRRSAMDQAATDAFEFPAGTDIRIDVRSARKLRYLRKRLFGEDIDSGPAWDILLHLFESHVLQRRDTVGNVTDGTELPGATALRWMARLEQEGLVVLRDDHLDRRRRYVELTESGVDQMTRYFSGAAPHLIAA